MVKKKEKLSESVEEDSPKNSSFNWKKINPWIVSTIVLAAVLVVLIGVNVSNKGISKQKAGEILKEFASLQGVDIEIKEVKDVGGIYEINFSFMGQEGKYYVSKDGKYVGQMFDFDELKKSLSEQTTKPSSSQQTSQSSYTEEDIKKLKEFNQCLASKGVKIYGANWCGWTQRWVATLGGMEAVKPIYVECTENEELCSKEKVTGYPTTKINGKDYSGPRTVEAIGKEVGCPVPSLTGNSASTTSNSAAQCG